MHHFRIAVVIKQSHARSFGNTNGKKNASAEKPLMSPFQLRKQLKIITTITRDIKAEKQIKL
jgi:hypothetical protein